MDRQIKAKTFDVHSEQDPRNLPAYGIVEAARYLRIPLETLRSWVRGRFYPTREGKRKFQPIIHLPDKKLPLLSFTNLIEAHILDSVRYKHKVPFDSVRRTVKYLEDISGSKHPLSEHWFLTDGKDLFIEKAESLINASRDGQLAMREILEIYLQRVERDPQGVARRLFPFLSKRHELLQRQIEQEPKLVVIDPMVSFGKPVLTGTGIPTSIIAERFYAGESIRELAADYGRQEAEIEEAIRYEDTSSRAA
jgi:uncharacterized protein (DUF433 family)